MTPRERELLAAIRAHRKAIEAAGTIRVADAESRATAKVKQAIDERLWAVVGRRS